MNLLSQRLLLAVSISACVGVFAARPAHAQGAPTAAEDSLERVVALQDGAAYRGELLEYVPRDHVTLRLASGQAMRFEWGKIRRISVPGSSRSALEVSPVQPEVAKPLSRSAPSTSRHESESESESEPGEEPEGSPPRARASLPELQLPPDLQAYKDQIVRVALRGDRPKLKLEYLADSIKYEGWAWGMMSWGFGPVEMVAEQWKLACKSPCGVPLARKATYRVLGRDIMTSDAFTLPSHGRDLTLRVRNGSRSLRVAAWVSLMGGTVIATFGSILYSVGALSSSQTSTDTAVKNGGIGLIIPGLAFVVGSIPMFVLSKTRVSVSGTGVRDDGEAD